jgi:hypothetical protein
MLLALAADPATSAPVSSKGRTEDFESSNRGSNPRTGTRGSRSVGVSHCPFHCRFGVQGLGDITARPRTTVVARRGAAVASRTSKLRDRARDQASIVLVAMVVSMVFPVVFRLLVRGPVTAG